MSDNQKESDNPKTIPKKKQALSHPEIEPSFSIHYLPVIFIFFKIADRGKEMAIPTAFWTRLPGIEANGVMALP